MEQLLTSLLYDCTDTKMDGLMDAVVDADTDEELTQAVYNLRWRLFLKCQENGITDPADDTGELLYASERNESLYQMISDFVEDQFGTVLDDA